MQKIVVEDDRFPDGQIIRHFPRRRPEAEYAACSGADPLRQRSCRPEAPASGKRSWGLSRRAITFDQSTSGIPRGLWPARMVGTLIGVLAGFEVWEWVFAGPQPSLRLWLLLSGLLAGLMPLRKESCLGHRIGIEGKILIAEDLLVAVVCTSGAAGAVAWITYTCSPINLVLLVLGCTFVLMVLCRQLAGLLDSIMRQERSYLIYGCNEVGVAVARLLRESENRLGGKFVGFIDEGRNQFANQPFCKSTFSDLREATSTHPDLVVDGVIIAMPNASLEEIARIRGRLLQDVQNVLIAPPIAVLAERWPVEQDASAPYCHLLGVKEFSLGVRVVKRVIDIGVASVGLLLFLPIMLLAAALVRIESPGPVIFRQQRVTRGNTLFDCYKLRTMRSTSSPGSIELTLRHDSRVTYVGRLLRRTSLDEVPQFLNVLQGHMSVVGPRPHAPGVKAGGRTYEEIINDFGERYKVKPGLTGLAQVSGLRGNTFTEEDIRRRFQYDIAYVTGWSLALELWIIAKTFTNGFWGRNAF
jgi:exopolysaccharide biosynthesis polyprenyl glycosylphosphotransferase